MATKITVDTSKVGVLGLRKTGKAVKAGATKAATLQRQKLRAGKDAAGKALPPPKADRPGKHKRKRPLQVTGETLSSIRAGKVRRDGAVTVLPRGYRSDDGKPHALIVWDYQRDHSVEVIGLVQSEEEQIAKLVESKLLAAEEKLLLGR